MPRSSLALLGALTMAVVVAGCTTSSPARRQANSPPTASSSAPAAPSPSPEMVKVPHIPPYVSVARAKKALARVGLVGVAPDVNFAHYFVRTKPASGTEVPVGSTVRLMIGDG